MYNNLTKISTFKIFGKNLENMQTIMGTKIKCKQFREKFEIGKSIFNFFMFLYLTGISWSS